MLYFLVRPLAEEFAELSERGTVARYAAVFAVCFVASLPLKPHLKPLPRALSILRSFCGGVALGRYTHSLFTQYVTQFLARLLENQPFIICFGVVSLVYSLVGCVLMYACIYRDVVIATIMRRLRRIGRLVTLTALGMLHGVNAHPTTSNTTLAVVLSGQVRSFVDVAVRDSWRAHLASLCPNHGTMDS